MYPSGTLGVLWRPTDTSSAGNAVFRENLALADDPGAFTVVGTEAKTVHGRKAIECPARMFQISEPAYVAIHLPASDIRPLDELLNVAREDPGSVDSSHFESSDTVLATIANRERVSQTIVGSAEIELTPMLYICGTPNRALQMVGVSQDVTTRAELEDKMNGFRLAHGDEDTVQATWGYSIAHRGQRILSECGAQI